MLWLIKKGDEILEMHPDLTTLLMNVEKSYDVDEISIGFDREQTLSWQKPFFSRIFN